MNISNLETRIREHYDPQDHPMVFELLDMLQEAPHDEMCSLMLRWHKTGGGNVGEWNESLCDCWKSKALENPGD